MFFQPFFCDQFVKNAREGKEHIGGLPDFEESEEEGAKLEL